MSSAIDTTLGTSIISILGVTDGQNILWTECLHVCSFEHKFNCYRIYVKYYYTMTTVLICKLLHNRNHLFIQLFNLFAML